MARTVVLNGVSFSVPESSDTNYDTSLTNYLVALSTAFPQLSGGTQSLTSELDLGASFGVKSIYYKSRTANPAAAGQVRLAGSDSVSWRNAANAADVALAKDSADALTWGGSYVTGNPALDASTAAGQVIASGATPIVVFGTVNTDTDSGYNAGTGRYTVPTGKGGDYVVSACVDMGTTQAGVANIAIFKNAVSLRFLAAINTQTANVILAGSTTVRLAAGDIIDIRMNNAGAGGQTLVALATANFFTMKRIPT